MPDNERYRPSDRSRHGNSGGSNRDSGRDSDGPRRSDGPRYSDGPRRDGGDRFSSGPRVRPEQREKNERESSWRDNQERRRDSDDRYNPGVRRQREGIDERAADRDAQRGRTFLAPSQRARSGDQPRTAAFDVLQSVAEQDSYANLVLPNMLRQRHIEGRDAAFTTELVYGTLRTQGRLDAVIERCIDRALAELDVNVLNVLRLGAYQLMHLRVPTHAAVSESVALARQEIGVGASKFVNAVLRKVSAKEGDEWIAEIVEASTNVDQALAAEHSHPEWIVRAMRDSLASNGRDLAELPDLLAADNLTPQVMLAARPGLSTAAELAKWDAEVARFAPTAVKLSGGDPGQIPLVRDGYAGVQDEGSQLVALAAHHAATTKGTGAKRQTWLDLCAGPGGKAAMLGSMAGREGHTLVAVELQKHRAELVKNATAPLRKAGADIKVAAADGRDFTERHENEYDLVVTDVPCTGLGALRRRPESRWRRKPSDLPGLTQLQRELVASAVRGLKTGGVLAYITCSPHVQETTLAVADILSNHPEMSPLDAREIMRKVSKDKSIDLGPEPEDGAIDIATGEGLTVQLWPHIHGTDAMFLALFTKEEA